MHRKKEDFILIILKKGVSLIACGIIVGILITLMNLIVSSQKIAISTALTEPAKASIFNFKKKPKKHPLKLTSQPQRVKVISVNDNNKITVKGDYTYPKTLSLYLVTFPPKHCYKSAEAHQRLEKLVKGKTIYVYTDSQASKKNEAYVQKGDSLIQETLLKEGLVVMYNYNGSEKYYALLKQDQDKARSNGKGVWIVPGYVTNNGYSTKVGNLHE